MVGATTQSRLASFVGAIGAVAPGSFAFRAAPGTNRLNATEIWVFVVPGKCSLDSFSFNPVRYLLQGKRVILVDDSIVRGTTSRKIVRMVRQAGAREVHVRISCPPTISPCFYGVDTPTRAELIASNHNVEEIRRFVEADSVGYLSIGSLRKAVADDQKHEYCYACYTGDYPTELVNIEELIAARQKRK